MSNRSIFYGWWVVAAFSVTTFISTGIRHAVGPFLKPMVADLHLDRASFSLVIAVSLFLYGVFMPIAGMLLDRFSVRVVASVGTVLLAISLVMTAMVRDFWEFAAVYGVLVPLGLAGTGPVIASGVVARWFSKRRGTALSVLGSASITGMSLLVPAVTWLILTTGWRLTYVVIAAGVLLLVLPLCLLVVRDSPESMGLTADGAAVKAGAGAPPVERVTAGEALQTLAFWQLAGSFFTCGITMAGTGSMTSALTADIYGRFSVSSVFGLIFLVHQTGSALGSWLAGALFETTGGYGAAFALACLFLAGAAIVALKIDRGARRIWRAAVVSAAD